ncbi:MAG: PAS domain S-box protein [Nitrospirae bacterium]|nr:PAS domain S-box protein [Nitrospirota bacterium]
MIKMGIKVKIIILVLITALPLFTAALYHEFKNLRSARSDAQKWILHQAHMVSTEVDTFLNGSERLLIALSEIPEIRNQEWKKCRDIFSRLKPQYPYYENIFVIDREGWVRCTAVKQEKPTYAGDRSFFKEVMKTGKFTVGEVQIGRITGKPVIIIAYPVKAYSDRKIGMVGAAISLIRVKEIFGHLQLREHEVVTLIDQKGRIITSSSEPETLILKDVSKEKWFKEIVRKGSGTFKLEYLGVERLTAVSSPSKVKWYASVGVPSEEIYSPIRKDILRSISFSLLILVLALAISWLFGNRIVSPLSRLAHGARELSAGGLGIKVEVRTGDELEDLAGSFNQMSVEIKEREEALREGEEHFRSLVQSAVDGIISADSSGKIISWNSGAEKIFGYAEEEVILKPLTILIPERYREAHQKGFERMHSTGESRIAGKILELNGLRKDGGEFPLEISLSLWKFREETCCTAIVRDITEHKNLEEQLRHAQKMEAIGQLAGGIAHDFNNMLNAIIGFGSLMEMNMNNDDPNRTHLKEILGAGERATHLTKGLLAYSRKQIIDLKPENLNEIIRAVEKFLRSIIGADIELKMILSDKELIAMVDSSQIQQVLMNIATNARDAMPDGGELIIEAGIVQMDEKYVKMHGYGELGFYALISITDTGIGMDEKTTKRIFEPFFTTKETGKGTGLGLSIVYGIIKQHGGFINVYSEPGRGTTFKIYLPFIKSDVEEAGTIQETAPYPAGGTEMVLIAEDNEAVRKLIRDALERFGYKVIAAEDGEDAIEKFMENKEEIRLLLLDLIMPRKNGKEVYEKIKEIKPDIKAIFLSGYTADILFKRGILDEGSDFILKPVSPREILRKVREVLDSI